MIVNNSKIKLLFSALLIALLIFCTGITTKAFTTNPKPTGDVTNDTGMSLSETEQDIIADNAELSDSKLKPHIKVLVIPNSYYSGTNRSNANSNPNYSRNTLTRYVHKLITHKRWQFGNKYHNGVLVVLAKNGGNYNARIQVGNGLDNSDKSATNQLSDDKCGHILLNNKNELQDPSGNDQDSGLDDTTDDITSRLQQKYTHESPSDVHITFINRITGFFKNSTVIVILGVAALLIFDHFVDKGFNRYGDDGYHSGGFFGGSSGGSSGGGFSSGGGGASI